MRIFDSCVDMISEVTRDLFSRGKVVLDPTRQGKITSDTQKELIGYAYQLVDYKDMDDMLEWARKEFNKSWLRKDVAEAWFQEMIEQPYTSESSWFRKDPNLEEYFKMYCLDEDGTLPYEYGERILRDDQLYRCIQRLRKNPMSRGAILSIWRPSDIFKIGRRVPCTLSYQILEGNMIVYQRSCDLVTFFALDVWKALRLHQTICQRLEISPQHFYHFISSLHAYHSDVPEDRKW